MSNIIGEEIMDLDLNQEPLESPSSPVMGLSPILNELETMHERIEERIRRLEAITSRIMQRRLWRQNQTATQVVNNVPEPTAISVYDEGNHSQERLVDSGKIRKMDGTDLIAKALGMEKSTCGTGGYFDCNICLTRATNPILTCCGHLFCWTCFYQLPCSYSDVKECPVCDGEVTDSSIIPIYGNGNDCNRGKSKSKESGLDVPPRPHAKRIESVRQKLISRGSPFAPMEETIQLRRLIDAIGERIRSQSIPAGTTNIATNHGAASPISSGTDSAADQQNQPLGSSRLLSLSSSLNSVVDSTERLVENLDSLLTRGRRYSEESSRAVDISSLSSIDARAQQDTQNQDTPSEINSLVPHSATTSVRDAGVSAIVVETGNQAVHTPAEIGSTVVTASLSSRRRTEASDVVSGAPNRSRRRRLR